MVHEEKTGCFKFGDRKWSEYVLDTSSTGLWSMVTDREMPDNGEASGTAGEFDSGGLF